jgi:hypothetical protein
MNNGGTIPALLHSTMLNHLRRTTTLTSTFGLATILLVQPRPSPETTHFNLSGGTAFLCRNTEHNNHDNNSNWSAGIQICEIGKWLYTFCSSSWSITFPPLPPFRHYIFFNPSTCAPSFVSCFLSRSFKVLHHGKYCRHTTLKLRQFPS